MFKKNFDNFVMDGDFIQCEVEGLTARATLYYDDDTTPPDQRIDGFWPSLDPKDAGYIGPKSKRTLARATKAAKRVMDAWLADEWHYYGVAVTIHSDDVQLTGQYAHACWGIEGNYPQTRKGNTNAYFRDVANEHLPEAIADAKATLARMTKATA